MGDEITLYCGNISQNINEAILKELFMQAGPIKSLTMPMTDKKHRGFAFIMFEHECAVEYAVNLFKDTELDGQTLNLRSKSRRQHRPPDIYDVLGSASEVPFGPLKNNMDTPVQHNPTSHSNDLPQYFSPPYKNQAPHNLQGPYKNQSPHNNYQGPDKNRAPHNNYQGPDKNRAPHNLQGPYKNQSPHNLQGPDKNRAPHNLQGPYKNQAPHNNLQGPDKNQAPHNYQGRYQFQSPPDLSQGRYQFQSPPDLPQGKPYQRFHSTDRNRSDRTNANRNRGYNPDHSRHSNKRPAGKHFDRHAARSTTRPKKTKFSDALNY